jgi:hypothetical protein
MQREVSTLPLSVNVVAVRHRSHHAVGLLA